MFALMIVPSDFPNGDAGAVRDDAFSKIYQELGYTVCLIGKGKINRNGEYLGTNYMSIYQESFDVAGKIKRFLFEACDYKKAVSAYIKQYGLPDLIHINSIPERTIAYLVKIAKKRKIPIVHDSVEWYSACEFRYGKLDKAYILKDRLNRKIIRKPIRVYSISSYLEQHFLSRGLKASRIPVIMDVANSPTAKNADGKKIKLVYAGNPATKDFLKEIVLGIELLSVEEKEKIELNILGVNQEQIKKISGVAELNSCIKARGRVSREAVQEELCVSDFSVLLRPAEERYTKAGFPTKSVEAMSHGVAMLCNISSDLGIYLQDMKNAVIVDGYSAEAFALAIRRILCLSRNEISEIKKCARLTAEKSFDYRLWVNAVKDLIEG